MKRALRFFLTLGVAVIPIAAEQAAAQSAALWSGSAQCQLTVQSNGYAHQEIQTWTIAPGTQPAPGAMQVYPASWTVSGAGGTQRTQAAQILAAQWNSKVPGVNAPIAIFVRASDNRLIIKSFHSQLTAPGAISGVRQLAEAQTNIALTATEWPFPAIEDVASSANVTGSGTIIVPGSLMPMQTASASGTANCTWQFRKGGSELPQSLQVNWSVTIPSAAIEPSSAISTLPAPTGFTARNMGDGSVQLSWQVVSGASQYRLDGTGIPSTGLYVPAPDSNSPSLIPSTTLNGASKAPTYARTTIQRVSPGPGTWNVASVDAHKAWNPKTTASTTAVIRYVPPHAGQWLTKNNGLGNASKAATHYSSLCPTCIPGMSFSDFLTAMGVSSDALADGNNSADICLGGGGPCTWTDIHAARYDNNTEFGTSRITRCWEAFPANRSMRTVCYSKSGDHGLTVIAKESDHTWFLTFAWNDNAGTQFPNPAKEVVNWFFGNIPMQSNYTLTTQVTLDSEGPKFPPHACLACHGGTFDGSRVNGATLLPLDAGLLRVDDRSDAMAENFIRANQAVMLHGPSPAVQRYLSGLYDGAPSLNSGWGDLDYVPQGWKQQSDFYKTAVRPYCMMCHLATPRNLDFSTYGSFAQNKDLINAEVCGGHTMPHAEYPFKQFWTKESGNIFIPGYLLAALGITGCQ